MSNATATDHSSAAIDALVLSIVTDVYANYRARTLAREPRLGVSLIVDIIRDHSRQGYDLLGTSYRPDQYRIVAHACRRLLKAGKLAASIGLSSRGREERQYEPGAKA